MELLISHTEILPRIIAFPDDRGVVCFQFEMSIYAVVASVQLCTQEPSSLALMEIGIGQLFPGLEPGNEFICFLGPKLIRSINRCFIHSKVLIIAYVRVVFKFLGNRVNPALRHCNSFKPDIEETQVATMRLRLKPRSGRCCHGYSGPGVSSTGRCRLNCSFCGVFSYAYAGDHCC